MAFGLNMLKKIKSHYRRQALQRVMMMGKGSCVHEEAEINNLQGKCCYKGCSSLDACCRQSGKGY